MNEEEKEVIETLKEINQAIKYRPMFSIPHDTKLFDTILNIIDKQQKEIKRLKEIEQAHKEENGKLRVELEKEKDMPKDTAIICMRKKDFEKKFKSDYISKNKIRKKIKECRKLLYCYKKDLYVDKGSMSCIIAQISILQSLLEE